MPIHFSVSKPAENAIKNSSLNLKAVTIQTKGFWGIPEFTDRREAQ